MLVRPHRRRFLLGATAALAWGGPAAAQARARVGRVAEVVDVVTLRRDGRDMRCEAGTPVHAADEVRTGPHGRVRIAFDDGSSVAIGSSTSVRLEVELGRVSLGGALDLALGILRMVWRGGADQGGFAIRTRAAVASVRSTDWIVEAEPVSTAVFVMDGRVDVLGTGPGGGDVALGIGYGTDVPLGGRPRVPAPWGEGRKRDVLARTDL